MTPNNYRIMRKDGTVYDLKELGVVVNRLIIPSPNLKTEYEELETDGVVDLGTYYTTREIQSTLTALAVDIPDYPLLINELYRMFDSRESFYFLPDRERGKRFEVKLSSPIQPQQLATTGEMSADLTCSYPYAESIGTTLDPVTFESGIWQIGNGLTLDETMYIHTTETFQIYNAGDGVTIDPRKAPLLITFSGASTNLEIKNLTTGDTWQYTGATLEGDTIKLDGVRSLKNDMSIFGATNKKIITLAPGYNEFQITGATTFSISFSFRFYSL